MKRGGIGIAAALSSLALLTVAMLLVRSHLSAGTTSLLLVVPVVIGVVAGGFRAGVVTAVAGFLDYDFFFTRPYLTLRAGLPENWFTLVVYLVVVLLVARVVSRMNEATTRSSRQSAEIRELFELSDLLVADKPFDQLVTSIVSTLAEVFGARQVAVLLPSPGRAQSLQVVACAGPALDPAQLERILPAPGQSTTRAASPLDRGSLCVLALATAGRPVGLLVLSAEAADRHEREPLLLLANHIALAIERAQLREQALKTRLSEEMARLAKTLVAAVSHDLRSPLASIKASSSTLADSELELGSEASRELAQLIDAQADRLAELVANLLDMSRIQSGVLQPRICPMSLTDLVDGVLRELSPQLRADPLHVDLPADLPEVGVDTVLVSRVLTNLIENAIRFRPKNSPIEIRAERRGRDAVQVSVTDQGPGVDPQRRDEIFEQFARRTGDVGAGLGLTIAKTFIEAHGQHIWVEDAPGGGARFCFTLPTATPRAEEARVGADSRH